MAKKKGFVKKWHVGNDGQPRKCDAEIKCPLGGSHFETSQEAQSFYEDSVGSQLDLPKVVDCDSYVTYDYEQRAESFVNSLSNYEKVFIRDYVQQDYSFVNESLWNGSSDHFNSAVNNILSRSRGDVKSLWRVPPQGSVKELVRGKIVGDSIELKGFTSTSEAPRSMIPLMSSAIDRYMAEVDPDDWETHEGSYRVKVPEDYLSRDPNVVFQFVTNIGGEVSSLSHMPQEKETMLPARSEWKIVGIKKNVSFSSTKDMFGKVFGNDEYGASQERQATVYQLMEN